LAAAVPSNWQRYGDSDLMPWKTWGTLLAGAMLTALATAAVAQPIEQIPGGPPDKPQERGRDREPGGPGGPRARLFISPFGEPFRVENGLGAWLAGADANHDGAVTLEEFRADAKRFFGMLDANHDGTIDGFEIQAYEMEIVPEITQLGLDGGGGRRPGGAGGGGSRGGGRRGGRGGGGGRGGDSGASTSTSGGQIPASGAEGAARFSLLNIAEPVSSADEDLNGRVSALEWDHAVTRRFEKLDHDKSGRLTAESLRALASPKKK
jgi:hypothetical protein